MGKVIENLKKRMDKDFENAEVITLYKYHKKMSIFGFALGICWLLYGVIELFFSIRNEGDNAINLISIVINFILLLGCIVGAFMIVKYNTNYKKQVQDELYQLNVAKVNKILINMLAHFGLAVMVISLIFDGKVVSFNINSALCTAVGCLFFALYHFFIARYEKFDSSDDDCEE